MRLSGAPGLCTCGGKRMHHEGDPDGCWCPRCLRTERDGGLRCRVWMEPGAVPYGEDHRLPVERDVVAIGHDHPDTAQDAAAGALPNSGTRRRAVYEAIRLAGPQGMTDDELERALDLTHQSASAARNTLVRDRLIMASIHRRKTRSGNPAIAWVVK